MLVGKAPAKAAKVVGVARQTTYTRKTRLDEGGTDASRSIATGRPAQLDSNNRMSCGQLCSMAPWFRM